MAKFWNFVLFQAGWFACIIGAANHRVFWAVIATLAYIVIHVWRAPYPSHELTLLLKGLIYGVSADSLMAYWGVLHFQDVWPSAYLSPFWMWVLWALMATTFNGSLSWLRGRPMLGACLGAICGPLSYAAGIRMGAGEWVAGSPFPGVVVVGITWGIAIPLFLSWNTSPIKESWANNA